jgi:flavin-dependent dehydrogenase
MRLVDGSRVVIVGGGPAGSLTALHLLLYAAEAGLSLGITILEARDFSRPGPGGCNKCAGILSPTLVHNLETLGLSLPEHVIQSELVTYILHMDGSELTIQRPDLNHRIFSVYRGGGPRLASPSPLPSFDGWLLEQAQARGADVQRGRVRTIQMARTEHEARPVVITARQEYPADLVVLATGVNARAPLDQAWGYRPPRTDIMAQDEVPLPKGFSDDSVHIYFDHPPGLIFGGLIPKGRYANISLLGHKTPPDAVNDFLEGHGLMSLFPSEAPGLCGCTPRVAVSMASNYYHDRLAAVGDAAVTRLYKDGIGAAFLTAQALARTAIQRGVGRADFAAGYRPVCQQINVGNRYGRWLFQLWSFRRRSSFLMRAWVRAIRIEASLPPAAHIHTRVLWGMFTGSESYQKLFWLSFSQGALLNLWRAARLNWRDL